MKNLNFLLEIGIEDAPYKEVENISYLLKKEIEINLINYCFLYKKINIFYTNRRLSVMIYNLYKNNNLSFSINRGINIDLSFKDNDFSPLVYKWLKKYSFNKEDIKYLITDKGIWLVCLFNTFKNINTENILFNIIKDSINNISFNKISMYWGIRKFKFIRPITSILLIINNKFIEGEILDIKLDKYIYGNINNINRKIYINNILNYIYLLKKKGNVILNNNTRKNIIINNINKIKNKLNAKIKYLTYFINKFTNTSELPNLIIGEFDPKYLNLPKYIIIYIIKDYFEYLPIFNLKTNNLLPNFIFISNLYTKNFKNIKYWTEFNINNTFNDIYNLFNLDLNFSLINYYKDLKNVIFRNNLGSLYDKTLRVENIMFYICKQNNLNTNNINRLCKLYKCDNLTKLGKSFPKLYGTIGMIYSIYNNEDIEISIAIKNQYLNNLNVSKKRYLSYVLSISDNLDTLIGNFISQYNENIISYGENDPFYMKRNITNIIYILINYKLNISLQVMLYKSINLYNLNKYQDTIYNKLYKFILNRLIFIYLNYGYKLYIIKSILSVEFNIPFIFDLKIKSIYFILNKNKNVYINIIKTYKRIYNLLYLNNILYKDYKYNFNDINNTYLMYKEVNKLENLLNNFILNNNYKSYLIFLNKLSDLTNNFLDKTIIFSKNKISRIYKINLLIKIEKIFNKIYNFYIIKDNY